MNIFNTGKLSTVITTTLLADNINTVGLNCAGTTNLAGDINITGNANIDTLNVNIVNSDLLPVQTSTYNLGSNDLRWKEINVGPGTINIAGPQGIATIGTDSNSIIYTQGGFTTPFINVGPTGSWKVTSSGTPGVNFDLVAQQNSVSGPTGPVYSLTNKNGLTGPTGPSGINGLTGPTGPSGIMSIATIPSSNGSLTVKAATSGGFVVNTSYTFTPSNTGLFLIQIPQIYTTTGTYDTSPLYETRMVIYDASGVIATDSRLFTLNTDFNPSNVNTNGGSWSGSLTCYANITTLSQKTVRIFFSVSKALILVSPPNTKLEWKTINIIPIQTNSLSTFVTFP
jgi:hypothetical protein